MRKKLAHLLCEGFKYDETLAWFLHVSVWSCCLSIMYLAFALALLLSLLAALHVLQSGLLALYSQLMLTLGPHFYLVHGSASYGLWGMKGDSIPDDTHYWNALVLKEFKMWKFEGAWVLVSFCWVFVDKRVPAVLTLFTDYVVRHNTVYQAPWVEGSVRFTNH